MELITRIFTALEDLTWGWSLIPILVIFGVFMTIVTGFVQIRYFGKMFRVLVGRDPNADPFPVAMRVLNDYNEQLKAGIERPVFDAAKFPDLNIDHAAWKIRAR